MKVYLVHYCYDTIVGVFSSEEKAWEIINRRLISEDKMDSSDYLIEEWEVDENNLS